MSGKFQKFLGNSTEALGKLSVCGVSSQGFMGIFYISCSESVNVCNILSL